MAIRKLLLASLYLLAGCADGALLPAPADPIFQSNSYLCAQMPPSGYCTVPENN